MAEAEGKRLRSKNPELPEECIREIVSRLNPKQWCRGCAVLQKLREASESDENWSFFLDKLSDKKCYLLSARDLCVIWGDTPPFWSWLQDKYFHAVSENKLCRLPCVQVEEQSQWIWEPRLQRKDGWLEAKTGDFFNEAGKDDELEIRLRQVESGRCKSGLIFEGIEIRPTNGQ